MGEAAVYHCITRTVNGEMLFKDREKEVLRKMLWEVADFSGVEILTYCIMSNHFHVLVYVPDKQAISDTELMRRYKVLYPKPTQYQVSSTQVMTAQLRKGGAEADEIRRKLLARMGDVSEFMKAVKQRFSVWFNRTHRRFGTLWAERFKSVLVEGSGNALQTMAGYIDLNPVRAGIVGDPKDYRFCGYAEAVAGQSKARAGFGFMWGNPISRKNNSRVAVNEILAAYRMLLFGKGAGPETLKGKRIDRAAALQVLEKEQGSLPKTVLLRCKVRYFTDGAVLGSAEFVRGFTSKWQLEHSRKHPPKTHPMQGADWGDLTVIQSPRRKVFS